MEYLQYPFIKSISIPDFESFKPYYKWNTFNTMTQYNITKLGNIVLNLIINGIPSILKLKKYMKLVKK